MTSSDQWRYTDDDGVQRLVDVDELRAALADARLKPGVLVWRRGMKQWLPAASVPELAPNSPISAAARASAHVQIGSIVAPSPSVPPPAVEGADATAQGEGHAGRGGIDELRVLSERRRKETSHGLGPLVTPAAVADAIAASRSAQSGEAVVPGAPRLPTIDIGGGSSQDSMADRDGGAVGGGRPRRITRVGGMWSSPDAKREIDETTTTLVRGEGSLAGAASIEELQDGATTTVVEDRRGARPKTAEQPDATLKPRGLRMPGASGKDRTPGGSVPPLARSISPPHSGPGTGLPARNRRTSRPPPPKRPAAGAMASSSSATGTTKSVPPPPPQHRSRRKVSGRPGPTPGGSLPAVSPTTPQRGPQSAQPGAAPPTHEAKPAGGMFSGEEATAIAPSPAARRPSPEAAPNGSGPSTTDPAANVADGGHKRVARTEPLPAQQERVPAPPAEPDKRNLLRGIGLPTAELPAGLGANLADLPRIDAAAGGAVDAAAPAEPGAGSAPGSAPGPGQDVPRTAGLPPTAELPSYAYPPAPGDPGLLELRPVPPPPTSSESLETAELPRGSVAVSPPPWSGAGEAPSEAGGRDSWPQVPARRPRSTTALTIRLSALVGAAVIVGLLLASSFLVGRLTAPAQSGLAEVVRARTGFTTVPLFARSKTSHAGPPRPCLMLRAPAQWAASASKNIPFEVAATPSGKLAIGYAIGTKQVQGLTVDPATGIIEEVFNPDEGNQKLSRVVPLLDAEGKVGYAETPVERAGVRNAVWAGAAKPFIVGFKDDACVALDSADDEPKTLWPLEPAGTPDALRTVGVVGHGVAVAYRHDSRSWYGWLNEDRSVGVPPTAISEPAAEVGKPMIASNGEAVSLVYADRAAKGEPAVIRWARGAVGKPLAKPEAIELPPGGPGGDAIAPAVAGLSGGRWMLMWTEGSRGQQRMLRAQTYAADGQRIGESLQVSPATGSFGQGTVGVEGESAAVLFLLQRRDGGQVRYELWGTVLQCQ